MTEPAEQISFSSSTYGELGRNLRSFEEILEGLGQPVLHGSPLEHELLDLYETVECFESRRPPNERLDVRSQLQNAVCTSSFIKLFLSCVGHPLFYKLLPHIKLLAEASLRQAAPTPREDQGNDKVFELYIAMAALGFVDDIDLDHPEHSRGDNPDLLLRVPSGRWALACKAPHSQRIDTLWDRIVDGVDQIERADCDVGLVVVTLKNLLTVDGWFTLDRLENECRYGVYKSAEVAIQKLLRYGGQVNSNLTQFAGSERIHGLFSGKKALPGVLFLLETAVPVFHNGAVLPSRIAQPILWGAHNQLQPPVPNPFVGGVAALIQNLDARFGGF